jgi:hypothetical protein
MAVSPVNERAKAEGELRIYDSTVTFRHFQFTLDDHNQIKTYDDQKIVETVFPTKVIESSILKVTLLPSYGGRILSIIYKPTGHELLYQNPVGTPYAIGSGAFYYNWLMVYGGIFPTFPEPEHGKAWGLPWEFKIVEQTSEKIAVEMRFTDNIVPAGTVPAYKFNNGRTDLTCIATVTVYRQRSDLRLNIRLVNAKDQPVKYEYWTCTTLAPGSEPGNPMSPKETEIVAPLTQVKLMDDVWPWMGLTEDEISFAHHTFSFKNLAHFENWKGAGIAYASPYMVGNWWGVINHRNEEGIIRVAENANFTPGLKLWTWGLRDSFAGKPEQFGDSRRPYIELWAGNSKQFFTDAVMKPNETKDWDEFYLPTVGLSQVTEANRYAAVYLGIDRSKQLIRFHAAVFSTEPGRALKAVLWLNGKKFVKLAEESFTADPKTANRFQVDMGNDQIPGNTSEYRLTLTSDEGKVLLETGIPFKESK